MTTLYVLVSSTTGTAHVENPDNYGFTYCGLSTLFGPLEGALEGTVPTCKRCMR